MRTLGIETSCDETAVSMLDEDGRIEANLLSSQIDSHSPYGGVVPELASREHLRALPALIDEVLTRVKHAPELVAVTNRPGLVGALLVGVRFAAAFSWARSVPLVAVDHLDGHLVSPFLQMDGPARQLPERTLALVASGGHSSWYWMTPRETRRLGRTRDDAAGETFDKVAQVIGLPYPGGPNIDRLARQGDAKSLSLPSPRLKDSAVDLSFSGLKSATIREIRDRGLENVGEKCSDHSVCDLLAAFEAAVINHLLSPLEDLLEAYEPELITASGGVASNSLLRRRLEEKATVYGVAALLPPPGLTTDNAAMIARAGQLAFERGVHHDARRLDARGRVSWQPPGMRRAREVRESLGAGD
jgi:N6-L-threonylcarbamoyladenine synthase